ncbi:cytochrome c oxidase assembly protein [Amycolatopsis anabasis]|uniref:cytochrome c oxidase assembly protein n=1 Tax=Amycolatopsis anabasis TaxID=1840409 RepID=UPI001FE2FBFC|nr:cytochrome c oxidase assembly protein [Amycolatopsis anabasis]
MLGRSRGALLVAALLAAAVVVAITLASSDVYALLGDTDPGALTSFGAGLLRLVAKGAGAVCAGALVFAVFLARSSTGRLDVDGYAALRLAGRAAAVWSVAAAALVPFDAADGSGQPVSLAHLPELIDAMEQPKAWLITLATTTIVAVACRFVLSWRTTLLLAVLALFALLPPVLVGHASIGAWHDVATNSIVWHVVAASVWIGALVALLARLRRGGGDLALRRYHRLTVCCWVVLGASGVVNGVIGAGWGGLTSTGYGRLVLVKLAGLLALGAGCVFVRRRFGTNSASRVVVVELVILGLMMGVSVGLAHLPPPTFFSHPASAIETLIGYELPDPPTVLALLTEWRFDLILGAFGVLAVTLYLLGVRRLRRRGDRWPVGRTIAWIGGWAAVLAATSSGLGKYSPSTFALHMVTHMTLNMLAPVLLVLAGPITLALRALPVAGKENPPGPREWLRSVVHSRVARFFGHPLVAAALFVGSYYALYFSGLFGEAMRYHWAHQLMNVHFLVTGYLFYWLVIGVDQAPRTLPHLAKLGMLFAVMPFHAFFAVVLMNKQTVIAETFYRYLSLPWLPDLLGNQRLGGGIAWATGEIPLVIVLIALLVQWARHDERAARRADRRADQGHDDELAAYNAMLAQLAAGTRDARHPTGGP